MFTPITINVTEESRQAALEALAFFQLGQTEKVTVEIEDDLVRVWLDDGVLSYPFDANEGMDRDVWYRQRVEGLISFEGPVLLYLQETMPLEPRLELLEEIETQFGALGGFAYSAAAAAIDTLKLDNTKEA